MASKILSLIPLAQSVALAGDNVKFVKKKDKKTKDFVGQSVKNIIGAELISETAKFTG